MNRSLPEAAPKEHWTLLRGARQVLTLRGPSGPRRGSALKELNVLHDGAVLICNGVIREIGSARRVENLKQAKGAREIQASGCIVMPAFVDPDVALVCRPSGKRGSAARKVAASPSNRLGVVSKHRLLDAGTDAAADWVRCGVLTVGAHTGSADNQRDSFRILRIHQTLQAKPLRIRSVFRPLLPSSTAELDEEKFQAHAEKSMGAIRKRNLATVVELHADTVGAQDWGQEVNSAMVRRAAITASDTGCAMRMRIVGSPETGLLTLALEVASTSLIAQPVSTATGLRALTELGKFGCIHVISAGRWMQGDVPRAADIRREIEEGVPLAIAAGQAEGGCAASMNPQFLLHVLVQTCGMSPEEAIVATTYNAACSLRLSHVTGSVEPGKMADLLVMDVGDYRDLIQRVGHSDVKFAIRAGHVVYRRGALTVD